MVSDSEIISLVKGLSLSERLWVVETILKTIREEREALIEAKPANGTSSEPGILSLAGIISEEEAEVFYSALNESRSIDPHEW